MTRKLLRASGIREIPGQVIRVEPSLWRGKAFYNSHPYPPASISSWGELERCSRYECIEGTVWIAESGDWYRLHGTGGGKHVPVSSSYTESQDLWECILSDGDGNIVYRGEMFFEPITLLELLFSP
jgi:hypothetical protein